MVESKLINFLFLKEKEPFFKGYFVLKNDLYDFIVVLIIYIIPSNFLGFVPQGFFIIPGILDLELLPILLIIPFFLLYFKQFRFLLDNDSIKLLAVLVFYLIFKFFHSLANNIPITEIITVLRKGYFTPITILALLLYIQTISLHRIIRIFRWIFILFIANTIIYILNTIGVPLLPEGYVVEESYGEFSATRIFVGFPIYLEIISAILLIQYIISGKQSNLYYLGCILFAVILTATRSLIAGISILFFIVILFYVNKFRMKNIMNLMKLSILALLAFPLIMFIKGDLINFIFLKFNDTINYELAEDVGTYAFRKSLVSDAFDAVRESNNLLIGNGYIRSGESGEYDFVMGSDSLIPAVIYCEGILGLIIRVLPLVYFFFISINPKSLKLSLEFKLVVFAVIISSSLNYMQTSIFFNYYSLFFFFSFELMRQKSKDFIYE